MDKRRNKSSQKQFMRTMIITGVLGLSVMMIAMLYMIKLFGQKKALVLPQPLPPISGSKSEEHIATEQIRGVVHDISSKRKNIKVWDIQEKQYAQVYIKEKAQITDSYGKPMSIQEIELGDIVEVTYDTNKMEILKLQKSAKGWTKSAVTGIDVNAANKTIKIGNVKYNYTTDLIVINDELEKVDMSHINHLDTLMMKGIDDTIWSIQVIQASGYLKLLNIPRSKGTVEIGNNTIYRLEDIEDNIPLAGGKHKIVVRIEGYQPFSKQITILTDEIQELDLAELEEAVVNLKIKVINTEVDYKIQLDNKTYKKDEAIKVKPGEYTLKITADGFKPVQMEIQLEEGSRNINIALQSENEELTPEVEGQNSGQGNSTQGNTAPQKPTPNKPEPDPPVEEIKTVQIIIETDPADAQVFVNGVYKGKTPTLTGLKPGEYSITIEKEGYSSLYSTIIIDASNAQKGFLYTLQKE